MSLASSVRDRLLSRSSGTDVVRARSGEYHVQPAPDSKELARVAVQVASWRALSSNIGRIRRDNAFQYIVVIHEANLAPKVIRPAPSPALERFEGFVVKVEGDWAHVTLTTGHGEELVGTYPAAELAARGVRERDRFTLATVEHGDAVRFDVNLIPRREVSADEQRDIREAIARELGDYSPDDDY